MENGISVIIPAYNREAFLAEAIQSILDQEFDGHLEIIIADDGSTDRTLPIVESFGNKVILLKKPADCKSQGVASTRNRGLKIATQPYICFLDSDDFYLKGHINKMVAILNNNPALGFVFCRTLDYKEENGKRLFRPWTHARISKKDILNPSVSRAHVVNTNSFFFRKEVFDGVGNFNESYPNCEDIDLWMRISEKFRGDFSNHFGAVYRTQHGQNQLTRNSCDEISSCLIKIQEAALSRYYALHLKDSNRIFELQHLILHNRYSKNKLTYAAAYLKLIAIYPIDFMHRVITSCFEVVENNKWRELENF